MPAFCAARMSLTLSPTITLAVASPRALSIVLRMCARIRLADREGVSAGDGVEIDIELQPLQERQGEPFKLVGADGKPEPLGLQPFQRPHHAAIGKALSRHAVEIMLDEDVQKLAEPVVGQRAATQREAALDHGASALTDQECHVLIMDRLDSFHGEHMVQARHQVGCCIDERSVEIEDDSGCEGHEGRAPIIVMPR